MGLMVHEAKCLQEAHEQHVFLLLSAQLLRGTPSSPTE